MSLGRRRCSIVGALKDRRGAAMVEYAMLLALVAAVTIGSLTAVGTNVKAVFTTLSSKL